MMSKFVFLFIFLVAVICSADEVQMRNSDRITGQIIKSDGKTLILKTAYAGDITISHDAIQQITSTEPVYVSMTDGKTLFGTITFTERDITIETTDAGTVVSAVATVAAIRSKDNYFAEVERYEHPGWGDLWGGFVEAGLSLSQGNSETINFALGASASRTTTNDKTSFYAASLYAQDSTTGESRTTANAIRGGGRYEYFITENLTPFVFTDMEHDEFQFLDLRLVLGGGLGWYLVKNDRSQFQIFGGGSYNYENFEVDESRNSAELLVGEDFSYQLSERVSFKEKFVIFPNLSDTGEFRMAFDAGIVTKMNDTFDWHLTVSDRYVSNPVSGAEENDLLLTTGVRISFNP